MTSRTSALKNTLISLTLAATCGLAIWSALQSLRSTPTLSTQTSDLPDAIMEDVTAVIMDKFGKPSLKIVTPKMVHFNEHDTTLLTTPEITIYHKSPKPWLITAKHAKATTGITHVDLWDDVTIHHPADENNPATLIKTPRLAVEPNKQTAETADLITLIQPNIVVKAVGMYADMNSGDIKLLSQARGEYVPST